MQSQTSGSPSIASQLVVEDPSYADVVTAFVGGLANRIEEMHSALRAADFDALRMAAHQLKGSGGGFGYPVLTEKAGVLEGHAVDRAIDDCLESFAELREICSRIVVTTR